MWFLRRLDKKNTRQHQEAQEKRSNNALEIKEALTAVHSTVARIEKKVDHQTDRLDEHIGWHAHRPHQQEVYIK